MTINLFCVHLIEKKFSPREIPNFHIITENFKTYLISMYRKLFYRGTFFYLIFEFWSVLLFKTYEILCRYLVKIPYNPFLRASIQDLPLFDVHSLLYRNWT